MRTMRLWTLSYIIHTSYLFQVDRHRLDKNLRRAKAAGDPCATRCQNNMLHKKMCTKFVTANLLFDRIVGVQERQAGLYLVTCFTERFTGQIRLVLREPAEIATLLRNSRL